jgi:GNAT superfamily N-acetyltransferase
VNESWRRERFLISTDPALLDARTVHSFLAGDAYWSRGIPLGVVERALANSISFGVYDTDVEREDGLPAQIGLARVISDRATFAYLSDVFILHAYRGRGLSKWLMEVILAHPDLQGLRRWMLLTADAHGLYRQFGFTDPAQPERVMERVEVDVYTRARPHESSTEGTALPRDLPSGP